MKTRILIFTVVLIIWCLVTPVRSCLNVISTTRISYAAKEVHISYPYAYVRCNGSQEIILMNISNPAEPYFVTSIKIENGAADCFYVEDNRVYVETKGILYIVDFSNIYNPSIIGSTEVTSDAKDIYVYGSFAYVLSRTNLIVVDISQPATPSIVSSLALFENASQLLIHNSVLYVTDKDFGLYALNMNNPISPNIISAASTNDSAVDLYAHGSFIYVADEQGGLQIFDISNPQVLTKVSALGFPEDVRAVFVTQQKAFLAWSDNSYDGGVYVVDVSNPQKPQFLRDLQLGGCGYDIQGYSNVLYFVGWDGSFSTLDYSQCQTYPSEPSFSWLSLPGTLCQVASGDFNADGKSDLAGVTASGQIFYTLNYSTWQQIPGSLAQITACDLNGDGKDDLAGVTYSGQIFYSTDLQNFKNIPGTLSQLSCGDFDGDGLDELVGLTSSGQIFYHLD